MILTDQYCQQFYKVYAGAGWANHQHVMSKKTIGFHFEFDSKIIENGRYVMQPYIV